MTVTRGLSSAWSTKKKYVSPDVVLMLPAMSVTQGVERDFQMLLPAGDSFSGVRPRIAYPAEWTGW